jgi:hemerythrin superfamily protein
MPRSKETKQQGEGARGAGQGEAASTGAGGKAASIDAIALLEQQHRAAESLFDEIISATEPDRVRRMVMELADLLIGHSVIEERHFYPAVRTSDTDELVADAIHDHQEMKKLLLAILEAGEGDEDFSEKLEELEGQVESHVDEEEEVLFPRARTMLAREELLSLGQRMTATLAQERESGEPIDRLSQELEAAGLA